MGWKDDFEYTVFLKGPSITYGSLSGGLAEDRTDIVNSYRTYLVNVICFESSDQCVAVYKLAGKELNDR